MRDFLIAVAICAAILIAGALLGPICCEQSANAQPSATVSATKATTLTAVVAATTPATASASTTATTTATIQLVISFNQLMDVLIANRRTYDETVLEMGKITARPETTENEEREAKRRIERCSANVDYINGLLARMAEMAVYERFNRTIKIIPNPLRETDDETPN